MLNSRAGSPKGGNPSESLRTDYPVRGGEDGLHFLQAFQLGKGFGGAAGKGIYGRKGLLCGHVPGYSQYRMCGVHEKERFLEMLCP